MSRVSFEYVSVESCYRQVQAEDGCYDTHVGYCLHAAVRTEEGHLDHYLHFWVDNEDVIARLQAKVERAGTIDLEHWDFQNRDHAWVNGEPDWAAPEFAYREKHGLPL